MYTPKGEQDDLMSVKRNDHDLYFKIIFKLQ